MIKKSPFLKVSGIHVNFPLHLDQTRSFRLMLVRALGIRKDEFRRYKTAIRNLSFTAGPGTRLALLGSNGSGKTTLLRTLNGVYEPSEGQITRRGSVAALINNTMGMDFYSSGLENIYLRGLHMGLSREEVEPHVSDIVEFAELGEDIYRPVRTYSSGMLTRLSFGIATSYTADIYLMDEWIGAGDARFFDRAQDRISKMFNDQTILILASHSDGLVKEWCTHGLVLAKGEPMGIHTIEEAVALKNHLMRRNYTPTI